MYLPAVRKALLLTAVTVNIDSSNIVIPLVLRNQGKTTPPAIID